MAATLAEETARIDAMVATGRVAVTVLGQSLGGHPLRLLRVGDPPPDANARAVLLIVGAQHGNEVTGREAALEWCEAMTVTTDPDDLVLLQAHGVLVMPTCNPDGVELLNRENLAGVDINRDHIGLTQPETVAIATVLRDARPALVVDLHRGGVDESAQMLGPTNVQADQVVVARSVNVINAIEQHFGHEGLTAGVWPGGAQETILRNNAGLRHLAAVLAEVDSSGTSESEQITISRAVIDASVTYTGSQADDMLAEYDQAAASRTAVGQAATAPFDLRSTVLDPPPTGYQLSSSQVSATVVHRDLMLISGTSAVSMAQPAQPLIPFLLDGSSESNVVAADGEFPVPPDPGPTPVAQATIRRRITWLGVHAVTGRIIAELPDVQGQVSRLLSAYQSARLTLPIPLAGPGAVDIAVVEQATQPLGTCLVAVVNDLPTWMGWVLSRRGGTGAELDLATVTPEGYLLRRRVRDHTLIDLDRTTVALRLLEDAGDLAGVGAGLGFDVSATLTGDVITRQYLATDREPVYDALRELAADGLEFTVDLDWEDNTRTVVRRILRIGPRVGKSDGAALFETTASSMFESEAGSEATYDLLEDHTTGKSANHLTVVAPGEGEDQPASSPALDATALDGGAPIVEEVVEVSSASTSQGTLDNLAQAELARVKGGAQVWEISSRIDAYPRPGIDAQIGDDVSFQLTGHRHPKGVTGVRRMIGYQIDQQAGMWRPILLQPGQEA